MMMLLEENNPPEALNDDYEVLHDGELSIPAEGVLDNDDDQDEDELSAVLVSGPSNAESFQLNSDGSFSYVPNSGFVGQDSFTYYASDGELGSETATVTIDVTNQVPTAGNDDYDVRHDTILTVPAEGVLEDDEDGDDDPITASIEDQPTNGTLNYFNEDGSFEYEPDEGFVGIDTFSYRVSDGLEDSNLATVTINVTNGGPTAGNDEYDLFDPDEPVVLPVLENDEDGDDDPLTITDVSPTLEGGEAWTDGTVIFYTLPQFAGVDMNIGGVVTFEDPPTSTDPPGIGGGGLLEFEDSFTYTISDDVGATDTALVQVVLKQGRWEAFLQNDANEAEEVGVDGEPGYDIEILQTYGRTARGLRAAPNSQTWQKNVQNFKYVYRDNEDDIKTDLGKNRVLADTRDVAADSRTPYRLFDRLSFEPGQGVDRVAVMAETVSKELGFNKLGSKLPVPASQPWRVTREDHLELLDQMNEDFGTLTATTRYVYLDKPFLEELKNQGKISNAVYTEIRTMLQGFGINYDAVSDKYEKYEISGLGSWEFPE